MKMKKTIANEVTLNLVVKSREATYYDKPASAGNVEKVVNFLCVYGDSIVKLIRLGINIYSIFGN
jgi:hypothetical protein